MTQYEIQLRYIARHADRAHLHIQTPKMLMWDVDNEIIYTHLFDEAGNCIEAFWHHA